jgi:hypothetical protein
MDGVEPSKVRLSVGRCTCGKDPNADRGQGATPEKWATNQ